METKGNAIGNTNAAYGQETRTRALEALLSSKSISAAATKSGFAETTLARYLKEPDFLEAYREASSRCYSFTVDVLKTASIQAIATLVEVMNDPRTSDRIRLEAARSILDAATKGMATFAEKPSHHAWGDTPIPDRVELLTANGNGK